MREGRRIGGPHFSTRTSWDTSETDWSRKLSEMRREGRTLYDLTLANPTESQFDYPGHLLAPLQDEAGMHYSAEPRGLLAAREAVCRYYRDHRDAPQDGPELGLHPDRIFITSSTSEAYSFLFRLLCDPGDEVLIAQPSYPLFDFLADLDDVRLVPYPLFYDYGWHLDIHALRQRISPRTRAVVVVHPNNPTGHFTSAQDRLALEQTCAELGLALIVDEVFLDYSQVGAQASFTAGEHPALTFVMSGLSKVAGLPQMKLSWICIQGPGLLREAAAARLEVIADTFLSVSTPMQHAMASWLGERGDLQRQIADRLKENLGFLDEALTPVSTLKRLAIEGGWYAILRFPSVRTGEEAAMELLVNYGVVVHAGGFFGLETGGMLVLSLLPPVDSFRRGVASIVAALA